MSVFVLSEIPRERWPAFVPGVTTIPFKAWIGEGYLVQAYEERDGIIRLTVNSVERVGRHWADRIPWDDLQAIKACCGYGDRDAVEVYPRARDLVNVARMRHLWVLPELVPFAWRAEG
ncbi:hypothetical protein D3C87_777620 [compost metagenome]